MSLLKYVALCLVAGNTLAAANGAMFGGGIEGDTDDGFSGSLIGSWDSAKTPGFRQR